MINFLLSADTAAEVLLKRRARTADEQYYAEKLFVEARRRYLRLRMILLFFFFMYFSGFSLYGLFYLYW